MYVSVWQACAHEFFDDLRDPTTCLPDGRALPRALFEFTEAELAGHEHLREMLIPEWFDERAHVAASEVSFPPRRASGR